VIRGVQQRLTHVLGLDEREVLLHLPDVHTRSDEPDQMRDGEPVAADARLPVHLAWLEL
jgi:hypothetical protein